MVWALIQQPKAEMPAEMEEPEMPAEDDEEPAMAPEEGYNDEDEDLDLDENIRIYLFSSTQHGAGVLPQSNSTGAAEGAIGLYGFNVVDYAPLLRACLINLHLWVSKNTEPPKVSIPN